MHNFLDYTLFLLTMFVFQRRGASNKHEVSNCQIFLTRLANSLTWCRLRQTILEMFPWQVFIQCLTRHKVHYSTFFVDNSLNLFWIEVNRIVGVLIWSQVCTNIRTWLSGHSGRLCSLYNVHSWPECHQHNLICRHLEIFLELEILAYFMQSVHEIYRVLSSREEGQFPVVD